MREPTDIRRPLFPSTQHQITGQLSVLKEARARITGGKTIEQARQELSAMIADLETRLAVNAAAGDVVLPEYLGQFLGGQPQGAHA
jgi:hypothetical protein